MRFDVFKGDNHSVAFDDHTERYSLFIEGTLVISSASGVDVLQRAADKGVTLTPVAFVAGTSHDNKPISVIPGQGKWEMSAGGTPVKFDTLSECVQAALAKRLPPPKRTTLSK